MATNRNPEAARLLRHILTVTPQRMVNMLTKHTGMTQSDLARQCDVNPSVITTIRQGRDPRYCTGKSIERVYVKNYDVIKAGEDAQAEKKSKLAKESPQG